ncbi:hypothetical protein [Mycolicibacterium litorale]|uniref:hypothetical protein n=1 Tax=Mycolicibacterium litorale TaxID=758802 RepID=UPI001066F7DF|nr:hypothetical protein [Mycolicibacterium litorale]MCV7418809.1 hypothetical protein [Mycolicibacterium litorale]TDY00409.1 hypothetical protein BCL50_5266 [Mycolicibacterium litorale]
MSTWLNLAEHLGAIPTLDGARCRGRYEQFDLPEPYVAADPAAEDRLNAAAADCRRCPALQPCARWVDGLRPQQRPAGVVAGRIFVRPQGRATTVEVTR